MIALVLIAAAILDATFWAARITADEIHARRVR